MSQYPLEITLTNKEEKKKQQQGIQWNKRSLSNRFDQF